MRHLTILLLFAFAPLALAGAKSADATRADVRTTFDHCMDAFRSLDGDGFDVCLDDDVSLFNPDIPEANTLHLVQGRANVSAYFRSMFDGVRAHAPQPRLDVQPRDVVIQLAGETAVVTFEFARADAGYGRRTMVLVHRRGRWKILHIHASNITPRQ